MPINPSKPDFEDYPTSDQLPHTKHPIPTDHWLTLADQIEQDLHHNIRHFTLRGAQMDWVINALRRRPATAS